MSHLTNYTDKFTNLTTAKKSGKLAPHKPILLLSVIDLIERGVITSNQIELTETLEQTFKRNWAKHVGESIIFNPIVGTPFWHLNSEPFWKLVPFVGGDEAIRQLQKGNPYSVGTIRKNIRYAEIDNELFELLQNEDVRTKLRVLLIGTYLQNQ